VEALLAAACSRRAYTVIAANVSSRTLGNPTVNCFFSPDKDDGASALFF